MMGSAKRGCQAGGAILIADSGGSKIDWRITTANGQTRAAESLGFNPYSYPIAALRQTLQCDVSPVASAPIEQVFFYGAGLTGARQRRAVQQELQDFFHIEAVEVQSDLLGAARALLGEQHGIAAILGTGANCGLYDGQQVERKTPCLGWILGDEGSGAHLGKILALDYLHGRMPGALRAQFREQHPWSEEEFLEQVYRGAQPARFLAGLSSFVAEHISHPYCSAAVCAGFESFYARHILAYANDTPLTVCFTGSIAFHYSRWLRETVDRLSGGRIAVGRILKNPIDALVEYHQRHLYTPL